MKALRFSFLIGLALGFTVQAQERVPQEEAQKYAKVFAETAAKLTSAQIKMDVDTDKAYALKKDKYAMMILPNRKLSEETLAKAGSEVAPVGQLWFHKLAPVTDDRATPNDKLRIVAVNIDNKDHELPLCLVGVRKSADKLELVVYAADKEPLLTLPVRKVEVAQELPIEFQAMKNENDTALITFNILGKYRATLTVAEQAP